MYILCNNSSYEGDLCDFPLCWEVHFEQDSIE
jgi:hypothetical protein